MKRILLLSVPLVLFAACPPPKKGCKDTGCSAGSVCNATTNACELLGGGGGGGSVTGGGGGSTGGGGGSVTGGGGGTTDAGFDAGPPVDPFDDGGTFVAGDICNYAIPVDFGADAGVSADGGAASVVNVTVDLAAATNQYKAACNSSSGESNDVIFKVTLAEPKGLVITATDTSGKGQDAVLSLISSPCPLLATAACVDTGSDPEVLTIDRLPVGTWYVLLENYAATNTDDGTYDVQFELTEPTPGPANDTCAQAQALTFTNGMATAMGTTAGAFNDTAGSPLTCSSASALNADVFYTLTLTQPQDVTVAIDVPSASNLSPAISLTNTCGVGGAGQQHGCATGTTGTFTGRSVPAGTYFIVVDGNGSGTGDFTLTVTLAPPTPLPMNDTCASPTTLVPMVSQTVDANSAAGDYTFSCAGGARGGDVVYQFTTTQPQKVTITATGVGNADAVLSLRGAPCDDSTNEVDCVDQTVSAPEVLSVLSLPAGTYYVVLAAYSPSAGQFGVSLALDTPPAPPANDTCASAATLVPNMSQMVDLAVAVSDYTLACAMPSGGDAVYTFTIAQPQRAVVTATPVGTGGNAVLSLRGPPCATATDLKCADNTFSGDPEVLIANNLVPGTYFVVLASDGADTQFGVELAIEPPRPPPTNESCSMPEVVTLTGGTASRTVDLTDAAADIASDLCSPTSDGGDVVYQVDIPAMQTLTVVGTPVGTVFDPVLFAKSPMCAMATSEVCIDMGGGGAPETLVVPNTTAAVKTVFVVVKGYRLAAPGEINLVFTAM